MDDDYDYSSGEEGFNEDALTNEEYDALYDALPKVKQELSSYNPDIGDLDIKETLYFHYFEIGPTLEELRERFPKKKAKIRSGFNSPSPDDKVLQAQKQAFEGVKNLSIASSPKSGTKTPPPSETKAFKKIDLSQALVNGSTMAKPSKAFVIIGHVDAGKSTLMGRILYDLGVVDAKTVNKLMREAEKSGKGSFALAWVMDQTAEERSRGVTIDICATHFETPTTRFTAIDAPGHKDFVPQMISGVSQADMALLVVDSINGEFEAGFIMDGQTKEHTIIAKSLGVDKLCVAVNKLDKENWSESRFNDIKEQLTEYLAGDDVGYDASNIVFVPTSGLTGGNVVKNDGDVPEFSWYKGPTLLDVLEKTETPKTQAQTLSNLNDKQFNMAINDIFDITSTEFKAKGKISQGMIQPGVSVALKPSEDVLQVQSVLLDDEEVDVATEGQIVALKFKINQLKNKSTDDLVIGDLAVSLKSSVHSVKEFSASLNLFNLTKPLLVGMPFVMFRNTASVAARISKIVEIKGSKKKKKMHLVSKQSADVIVEVLGDRPFPLSTFEDNMSLGRVVLRREGVTIGAGTVTKLD